MVKIKRLINTETRVSMLQTCLNVAGSNYQGKKVQAKTIIGCAQILFKEMVKEIIATEANKLLVPKKVKKIMKKVEAQKLINKAFQKK